eukprot:m.19289 g.19289  ORF g.19289 m.19289 type:complete len:235 (+) comp8435_c0_seq1:29-733(+)
MTSKTFLICLFSLAAVAVAQDPAQGWMGYAKGVNPSGSGIITHVEAKWKVGANPTPSQAFFSPWFGIETTDNLNLIQPVNPWLGNEWQIYNEYFQWQPTHNENSRAHTVQAGDVLFGSVTYDPVNHAYNMYHADLTDGWSVNTTIPVQQHMGGYKQYTIIYFVYEKVWSCDLYPPDGEVTFYDIKVEYNNKPVTPRWSTSYVDDNCNNRANIVDDNTIKFTWDTQRVLKFVNNE